MIITAVVNSFVFEILQGIHTPDDQYRIALYTADADLTADTDAYTTDGEVVNAPGYFAGGQVLTGYAVTQDTDGSFIDWDDVTWSFATITARAAMIYNYSKDNRAVAVFDLGKNFVSTNGNFLVTLPDGLIGIGNA